MERYGTSYFSQSEEIKNKKINTCMNKYGVDNPSKLKSVKNKKRKTCLTNYGVDNPSKSIEIQSKKSSNTLNKVVISPNGKIYHADGYEPIALRELFQLGYSGDDVLTRSEIKSIIGVIRYEYDKKNKIYHPDIYVKSENKIIEVKSEYWFHRDYLLNMKKKSTCEDIGLHFEFWIYDSKLNKRVL